MNGTHEEGYRTRDHLDGYREKCVGCGSCRDVCPSYRNGGCDPLAVMQGDNSKVWDCVGCGNCSRACEFTDPKTVMLSVYNINIDKPVSQCFLETGMARPIEDLPAREELPPEWTGDDLYVMPGCIVNCLAPHLESASASALRSMGVGASELPDHTCCMYPIQFGVMADAERDGYRRRMGEKAEGRGILTLCAGCSELMQGSEVDCEHVIPFLHRNIDKLPRMDRPLKVSAEPGCSSMDNLSQMNDIIRALGCEPIGNQPGCCGKASKKVSEPLMTERQKAAEDADVVVVGCPMCYTRYDAWPDGKPVLYIMELVASAFGDMRSLKYHTIPLDL